MPAAGLLQRVRRETVGQVADAGLAELLERLRKYLRQAYRPPLIGCRPGKFIIRNWLLSGKSLLWLDPIVLIRGSHHFTPVRRRSGD